MTRLYVDKREVAPLPAGLDSLDQVLNLVESNHLSPGLAVRQVQVDGVPLIQNDGNAGIQTDIGDRENIEVFTSSLREVALDSIREAQIYLERADAAIPSLSSSLQIHAELEIASSLRQFYDGIYFVSLLLQKLEQSFHIPFADIKIHSGNAQDCCVRLAGLLNRFVSAHEKGEHALLADLLGREFGPLIPAFKETFDAIRSRILKGE